MNENQIFTQPADALSLMIIELMKTSGAFKVTHGEEVARSLPEILALYRELYEAALESV